MLKAADKSGQLFYSFELTERPKVSLVCPECGSPVIFKNGALKVAHFAHKPNSDCFYGTGESEAHMLMKKNFYEMMKRKYPRAEVVIEDNSFKRRRADISIKGKDRNVVVEFQVSKITSEEIIRRTKDYNRQGCYVLWIFHISRLKCEKFFEKGRKRMAEEIRMMESLGLLQVMTDGAHIRKAKLLKDLSTKTMRKCVWEKQTELHFMFDEVVTKNGEVLKVATLDHLPHEYPDREAYREKSRKEYEQRIKLYFGGDTSW